MRGVVTGMAGYDRGNSRVRTGPACDRLSICSRSVYGTGMEGACCSLPAVGDGLPRRC